MKKSILTLLVFLACVIQTTTAYEYFTIYFSDGTKSEAFYATDVDSICYSKLSLDSIAYEDWQVQEIYTCDSVYRYPLAQIDSLSFKEVDEDEMVERTAHVCCNITPYYAQCESIDEISEYLTEIKKIDGVEDARVDGQTLFVKVEGSGTLTYDYTSEDEPYEDLFVESMQSNTRSNFRESVSFDHQDFSDISNVCVINQQYRDEERKHKQNAANQFIQFCNELGLYCNPVNDPTPQFFSKEIYNYDLIFMITHGYYDKETGLHWFLTGEQLYVSNKEGDVDEETLKNVIKEMWRRNSMTNLGMLSSNFIYIGTHKEVRNEKKVPVYYTQISNKYISVGNEDFRKPGKAIIFNTACQSLMGKKGKDNNNLAKAFFKRGAGLYMGYNEENYKGHSAGVYFLAGLMNGKSSYGSYMSIPIEFRDYEYQSEEQNKKVHPVLKYLLNPKYNYNICITQPLTLDSVLLQNEESTIKLSGGMYVWYPYKLYSKKEYNNQVKMNTYGFQYSETPDMANCSQINIDILNNNDDSKIHNYYEDEHVLSWHAKIDYSGLKPNTTYYYRAYMNDGFSNCYGEIKQFTTKEAEEDTSGYEAYYVLSNDYTTITFYYDNRRKERGWNTGICYTNGSLEHFYSHSTIKKAVFDSSFSKFRPTGFNFSNWEQLISVENIKNLIVDGSLNGLFSHCSSLINLDFKGFNTSNVTSMAYMFDGCNSLTDIDLSNFNTSKVTSMHGMFLGCSSLISLDLSSFNTANVTDMGGMFLGCSSLASLNLNSFNTANVTFMGYMFYDCKSLTSLDLSNFNTANVRSDEWKTYSGMEAMFEGCSSLISLDLSSFNTANVTDMGRMFLGCSSLVCLDLSSFNTKNVWDMSGMFQDCTSLKTIYADNWKEGWNEPIFGGCNNLVGGKGTKIGKNIYGYDTDGSPLYYYCEGTRRLAHIDGGKDNPGLFTTK